MKKTLTLLEACELFRLPAPVTEADLDRTIYRLHQEMVTTPFLVNLEDEPLWEQSLSRERTRRAEILCQAKNVTIRLSGEIDDEELRVNGQTIDKNAGSCEDTRYPYSSRRADLYRPHRTRYGNE